jgi:hypothetical protein
MSGPAAGGACREPQVPLAGRLIGWALVAVVLVASAWAVSVLLKLFLPSLLGFLAAGLVLKAYSRRFLK